MLTGIGLENGARVRALGPVEIRGGEEVLKYRGTPELSRQLGDSLRGGFTYPSTHAGEGASPIL
jgi:hypothetical protein